MPTVASSFLATARRTALQIMSQESNAPLHAHPTRRSNLNRKPPARSARHGRRFRLLFWRNPEAAIARVDFVSRSDDMALAECFRGIGELAPKERIAQARDEIRQRLTRGLNPTTPKPV